MSSGWQKYVLLVEVEGAPENPERFEIETAGALTPIMTYSQDGFSEAAEQLFVSLETLVRLGKLAQEIIDGVAIPDEEGL